MREVEWYQLDIFGLTLMHSLGSGTRLLERGWTLSQSGVALRERWQAGVGILVSPQVSVCAFFPGREEGRSSLCFQVGEQVLIVICTYVPIDNSEYPTFLESLGEVFVDYSPGDSGVLLGDVIFATVARSWREVIGMNSLPDLRQSGVLLLDRFFNNKHNFQT